MFSCWRQRLGGRLPRDLWALFIVLSHPLMDGLAHFGKRAEEISVEHLISEALVETFDVPVLHGLAGLNVMEADLMIVAPSDELGRDEFRAIVDPDLARHARDIGM